MTLAKVALVLSLVVAGVVPDVAAAGEAQEIAALNAAMKAVVDGVVGEAAASGKAQEHRAASRLHPFPLQRQEAFLDRVAH